MRVSLTPIYVIHRRPYSETSAIVEAFTRDHGRIGLLAKGARRPRSRWAGALEPFQTLLASWSGRGALPTLTGLEVVPPRHRLDGALVIAGLYLNELLMRLTTRHDPHPELFEHYATAIGGLATGQSQETTMRVFEKRLLDTIGYGLMTHHDADTGECLVADDDYYYVRDHGPSRQPQAGCKVSGEVLLALATESLTGEHQLREAKRLMRFVLAPHLGDKPLQTRTLYQGL